MIVYQVVACDGYGYEEFCLELCLTREIAENIIASKNNKKLEEYGKWFGSEDYQKSLSDMTSYQDGSFEQWDKCNESYSIRELEVVC